MSRLVALRDAGFEALAALHAEAFDRPWASDEIETMAAAHGAFGVAAMEGRDLLGFILLRAMAGEAEVLTVAVAAGRRRQGVGRALVEAAAATARSVGAEEIFLEVAQDNPAAIALYEEAGYETVGRRPGYYPRAKGAVDAILLRARLNSASAPV